MSKKIKISIFIAFGLALLILVIATQNLFIPINNVDAASDICHYTYHYGTLANAKRFADSTSVKASVWAYMYGIKLECRRQTCDGFYYVLLSDCGPCFVFTDKDNYITKSCFSAAKFNQGVQVFDDWLQSLKEIDGDIHYYFTLKDSENTLLELYRAGGNRFFDSAVLLEDGVVKLHLDAPYSRTAELTWTIYSFEEWETTGFSNYTILEVDRCEWGKVLR